MAEVTRYMPWSPHETVMESKAFIDRCENQWTDGEAASYVIRPRDGEDGEVRSVVRDGEAVSSSREAKSASRTTSGASEERSDPRDGADEFAGVGALGIDRDRRTGTLGIWLRKRFWGRGYSGERAGALMALAFERLDLEVVSVSHHADNDKSRRAIETYIESHGGRCEGLLRNWLPYEEEVADEYRYTVTREEYRAATE